MLHGKRTKGKLVSKRDGDQLANIVDGLHHTGASEAALGLRSVVVRTSRPDNSVQELLALLDPDATPL